MITDAQVVPAEPLSTGARLIWPKALHRKLREIAFTTDQKVHDIIMEGINAALQRYGHPSVALRHDGGKTR